MQMRIGYELVYECPQATPMLLTLNVHFTRVADLVSPDHVVTSPAIPITGYRDGFGNWCTRLVAPPGDIRIATDTIINDSGLPDPTDFSAVQHAVEDLPALRGPVVHAGGTGQQPGVRLELPVGRERHPVGVQRGGGSRAHEVSKHGRHGQPGSLSKARLRRRRRAPPSPWPAPDARLRVRA